MYLVMSGPKGATGKGWVSYEGKQKGGLNTPQIKVKNISNVF